MSVLSIHLLCKLLLLVYLKSCWFQVLVVPLKYVGLLETWKFALGHKKYFRLTYTFGFLNQTKCAHCTACCILTIECVH